jgi:hypothetical protein
VSSTSQRQIAGGRLATSGERNEVMELEEAALGATPLRADERALSGIPCPDEALYRGGNVPRSGRE